MQLEFFFFWLEFDWPFLECSQSQVAPGASSIPMKFFLAPTRPVWELVKDKDSQVSLPEVQPWQNLARCIKPYSRVFQSDVPPFHRESLHASVLSCVQVFATQWTVAHQASLSHKILLARMLKWVAISSSRGSFQL